MEKLVVRRVGVLVKPNQPEALQTICRLVEWCAGRGITVAGGPRLQRERIEVLLRGGDGATVAVPFESEELIEDDPDDETVF